MDQSKRRAVRSGYDCPNCGKTTSIFLFAPYGATFYTAKLTCGYCNEKIQALVPIEDEDENENYD